MARRLDIAAGGSNVIEPPLGDFDIQIRHDAQGFPEAILTATVKAPRSLSESQRASAVPTTVELSMSVEDAIRLATELSGALKGANVKLPLGVLIQT